MKGSILYLGQFNPNENFSSFNRAVGILKLFHSLDYDCHIHAFGYDDTTIANYGYITFHKYPDFSKAKFYKSSKEQINLIDSISDIKAVVLYNYPSLPMKRIIRYCKCRGIKVIADSTEWHNSSGINLLGKVIKEIDVSHRMRVLNKMCDGIITISDRMANYYRHYKTIKIYPLFDSLIKKKEHSNKKDNLIIFGYAGDTGRKKDDLISFVNFLSEQKINNYHLELFGKVDGKAIKYLKARHIDYSYHGLCKHDETINELFKCDCQVIYRKSTRSNNFGFPTKFAESMCLELPVISTNISDISDFVNTNSVFIIDGKNETFADFLQSISKDKSALQFDKKPFQYETYLKPFLTFLNGVGL